VYLIKNKSNHKSIPALVPSASQIFRFLFTFFVAMVRWTPPPVSGFDESLVTRVNKLNDGLMHMWLQQSVSLARLIQQSLNSAPRFEE
jgi:hypothetical protein